MQYRIVCALVAGVLAIVCALVGARVEARAADATSGDLRDFVTAVDVRVDGQTQTGDSVCVKPGSKVTMRLSFAENEDLQFDEDSLAYQLPTGFDYGDSAHQGTFPMRVSGHDASGRAGTVALTVAGVALITGGATVIPRARRQTSKR